MRAFRFPTLGGTVPLPSGSTSASLRAAFPAPPRRPRALSISSEGTSPFMTPTVQSLPHPRRVFRGEFALCIIAVLNSFAVYLMLYSGAWHFHLLSAVHHFGEVLPVLSLGTWTYLFQTSLVAVLMLLRRKFVPSYLLAFLVGFAFGEMMDVHALWIDKLPLTPVLRVVYFLISFAALTLGIALSNHCKLPIIPTESLSPELAVILNKPYKTVKTRFDLGCLTVTVVLSLLFLHGIRGHWHRYGILRPCHGGWCIFWVGERLTRHFVFVSFLAPHPEQDP